MKLRCIMKEIQIQRCTLVTTGTERQAMVTRLMPQPFKLPCVVEAFQKELDQSLRSRDRGLCLSHVDVVKFKLWIMKRSWILCLCVLSPLTVSALATLCK